MKFFFQVCLECLKALAIHTPRPVVRFDQCPGSPQIRRYVFLFACRATSLARLATLYNGRSNYGFNLLIPFIVPPSNYPAGSRA
jgi:hypothetical protein